MKFLLISLIAVFMFSCGVTGHKDYHPYVEDEEENYVIENVDEEHVETEQYEEGDYFSVDIKSLYNGMEGFSDVAFMDKKGNFFYTKSTNQFENDKKLIKLDKNENLLWEVEILSYGDRCDISNFSLNEITGEIIITGGSHSKDSSSAFLAKVSKEGSLSWMQYFPKLDSGWAHTTSIAIDSKENIYVSGYVIGAFSGQTAGDDDISSRVSDGFVGKWDKDGKNLWIKQSGKKYTDVYSKIAADKNDDLYLTGTENILNEYVTAGTNSGTSMFVAKWTSDGKEVWKKISRHENEVIYGIDIDVSGDDLFFLGDRCEGVEEAVEYPDDHEVSDDDQKTEMNCYVHPFLRKYDKNGNKIWEKRWRGKENKNSVTTSSGVKVINDKIYTVLNAWDRNGENSDIMISVFNSEGKHDMTQIFESNCQDYPSDVLESGDETSVVVTGISDGWIGSDLSTAECESESFRPFLMMLEPKEE